MTRGLTAVNSAQKLFSLGLAAVVTFALGGALLGVIADSRVEALESGADMNTLSSLQSLGGWLFTAALVLSIIMLRYARRHEAAIREQALFARLLTVYRVLFWLACLASLLALAAIVWLGFHLGPVR